MSDADQKKALRRRSLDAVAFFGLIIMLSHALLGSVMIPLYLMALKPEAPISQFFAFCFNHAGGVVGRVAMGSAYALSLFAFFVWSICRLVTSAPKNRKS